LSEVVMNSVIKNDINELLDNKYDLEKLRNKRIHIIGINSLIGKYLTCFFLELNRTKNLNMKIMGLARNKSKAENFFKDYNEDLEIISQDVCEKMDYPEDIEYMIYVAGYASASLIANEPESILKANTLGVFNAIDLAKKCNTKNFVFASTREVYGKVAADIKHIKEDDVGALDQTEPRNCYPESKRLAESILISYHKQHGIPYTILRIAHSYGPAMDINKDGRVMSDFISSVVNDENIKLNSDGTALRSFCYIADTVDGIIRSLLSEKLCEAYNLANETESLPIRETAQLLVDLFPEKNLCVEFVNADDSIKAGYNRIPLVQMDTSKMENLGWNPHINLMEGLKRTIQYFEEEKNNSQ